MRIFAKRPAPMALNRLWKIHCEMQEHPDLYEEHSSLRWLLYQEGFSALRAGGRLDPRWLEQTIERTAVGHTHIQDLAYLVANLQDGGQVWRRCKAQLFQKVPDHKARAFVTNIAQFQDVEEVDRLLTLVDRTDDGIGATALRALTRIAPDHAIEYLIRLAEDELSMFRGWYMPLLLEIRRDQVSDGLLDHMKSTADPWRIALVYQGYENDMDDATVDFLLAQLEQGLAYIQKNPPPPNQSPLLHALNLLAKVNHLGLIMRQSGPRSKDLIMRRASSSWHEPSRTTFGTMFPLNSRKPQMPWRRSEKLSD